MRCLLRGVRHSLRKLIEFGALVEEADGTFAEGAQNIIFWGIDPVANERRATFTDLLGGRDITMSPSGSCGINKSLQIELPFRLSKL